MKLHRFSDAPAAAHACAGKILTKLRQAIEARGAASLAVSGGSSPRAMFEIFGRRAFPWQRVHLFWVDERVVPASDPQSNFKLANDTWLLPAKFPAANIHRVETELGPEAAARSYEAVIRKHFGLDDRIGPHYGELPLFDVIHRGMGPDGHTASLFPGEPLIENRTGICAAVWVEKMNQWRVTLLPGVLEATRRTMMLVTGADKAEVLKAVLKGEYNPRLYPSQIASLDDATDWFVDEAACTSC
jgi:6-phosphogluconolactonase